MKSVSRILSSQSTGLQSLLERAAVLDGINQRLLRLLPAPLNEHVYLANIRDDVAVVMAESSAWLTRARYLGPDILTLLRQEPGLERMQKLIFKIRPETQTTTTKSSRPHMSENTAELLMSTAKIVNDPQLKAALHKLSRSHHKE